MSGWASNPEYTDEPLIQCGSWGELNEWLEECAGVNGRDMACAFIEEQYVLGCYQLYRNHELLDVIRGIYSDSQAGKEFEIVGEVHPHDTDFDLCSLPLYRCRVGDDVFVTYPEEIFVNY